MAIIKCKMCGGDIEISGDKSFGVCEYCGSTMTLPKVDNDQKAVAFNRGNHFRRIGEFDKALAVYEKIVAEDNTDAEAHWCCALCRFGIEYVEDPITYEWMPTCHRVSFDSFLEDVDYLAAVEYSDGITCRQYQKDAAKIAEVQRGILAISQKEEAFDVFICYKESDENGQRTVDSSLAQDIYYQLTDKGRRVFFARITLEDKGGTEYEPYIFAALNSAKVMVVVGTKEENLNAVWVKNEWSRFLSLMKKDHTKLLLPCYRDMDPYDLPEQLSILQSYDMSKIGFIQDLIRGIDKILDAGKLSESKKETVVIQGENGVNIAALIMRGNMALKDEDWSKANDFFDRVLDNDAKCAEAYLGKALAELKVANLNNFKEKFLPILENIEPTQRLVSIPGHKEREEILVAENEVSGYLEKENLEKICEFNFHYASRLDGYEKKKDSCLLLLENKNLSWAQNYADDELRTEITSFKSSFNEEIEHTLNSIREKDEKSENNIREQYEQAFLKWKHQITQMRLDAEAKRDEDYQKIIAPFESIVPSNENYENVVDKVFACAESLFNAGDIANAAIIYGKIRGNKDAARRSFDLWSTIAQRDTIACGAYTTVGLKSNGTVVATGKNDHGQCNVESWNDIVAVSAGDQYTVGLKSDGTVVAVGSNECDRCNVEDWNKIVSVNAFYKHTVGLKSDGTVVATGNNDFGQCNVSEWENIMAISAGGYFTIGLKTDGTVVAAGNNDFGQCNVSGWKDIVAVSAGGGHTVGLKQDGTVIAVGNNKDGECEVSAWKNILAVNAGMRNTVGQIKFAENKPKQKKLSLGIKTKSRIEAVGWGAAGIRLCKVGKEDVVSVYHDFYHTVGLKTDGTVVASADIQGDVSGWSDIKIKERQLCQIM